jgi:hypothetical protein
MVYKTGVHRRRVYAAQKDAKKPILHQEYELAIGGAARLLKNRSTQQVATKVDISGPASEPNLSTWQAVGQFSYECIRLRYRARF